MHDTREAPARIVWGGNSPIRPSDITLSPSNHTMPSTFGKAEVEESAGKLIAFFQRRGDWVPFTIEELTAFYRTQGWNPDYMFFGLMGAWKDDCPTPASFSGTWRMGQDYLRIDIDGKYYVTDFFIRRCMRLT